MANLSGITGKTVERKGGPRYRVNWQARFFQLDKVIHSAEINAAFKGGFCLRFTQALPIGTTMNLEFAVKFQKLHRIRVKATVDYCFLRADGDGADLDLLIVKIGREDQHLLNNILQELSEAKQFNLRT